MTLTVCRRGRDDRSGGQAPRQAARNGRVLAYLRSRNGHCPARARRRSQRVWPFHRRVVGRLGIKTPECRDELHVDMACADKTKSLSYNCISRHPPSRLFSTQQSPPEAGFLHLAGLFLDIVFSDNLQERRLGRGSITGMSSRATVKPRSTHSCNVMASLPSMRSRSSSSFPRSLSVMPGTEMRVRASALAVARG